MIIKILYILKTQHNGIYLGQAYINGRNHITSWFGTLYMYVIINSSKQGYTCIQKVKRCNACLLYISQTGKLINNMTFSIQK